MSFTHLVSSAKLASRLTFGRNGAQNVYYYTPLRAANLSCASTWKSITREERALQQIMSVLLLTFFELSQNYFLRAKMLRDIVFHSIKYILAEALCFSRLLSSPQSY